MVGGSDGDDGGCVGLSADGSVGVIICVTVVFGVVDTAGVWVGIVEDGPISDPTGILPNGVVDTGILLVPVNFR